MFRNLKFHGKTDLQANTSTWNGFMEWFHGMVTISNNRDTSIESSLFVRIISYKLFSPSFIYFFVSKKERSILASKRGKKEVSERIIEIDR